METPSPNPMPMCPMAETCKGMMSKPFSGFALAVPGVTFVLLGILIVFEPRIVAWVMAAAFVFIGAMMLMMRSFIRRIGRKFQEPTARGSQTS